MPNYIHVCVKDSRALTPKTVRYIYKNNLVLSFSFYRIILFFLTVFDFTFFCPFFYFCQIIDFHSFKTLKKGTSYKLKLKRIQKFSKPVCTLKKKLQGLKNLLRPWWIRSWKRTFRNPRPTYGHKRLSQTKQMNLWKGAPQRRQTGQTIGIRYGNHVSEKGS